MTNHSVNIETINAYLDREKFSPPQNVEGRASVADLYKPGERCGIYVFNFANGEWYAGQAVDVSRRFVQHTKNHPDIRSIRFRPVDPQRLNSVEQSIIHSLEDAGCRMRNVIFTKDVAGDRDFDQLMPLADQEAWLQDTLPASLEGTRLNDPALHASHRNKFTRWQKHPQTAELAEALRLYITTCLPVPLKSETVFWSLTCRSTSPKASEKMLNRLNIYLQEVLTLYEFKPDPVEFHLHLARSPMRAAYGPLLLKFRWKFPKVWVGLHRYVPGGEDQTQLICHGVETFKRLLQQPAIIAAARLFNLRLMRKGACIWSRSHCLDLVDHLVSME